MYCKANVKAFPKTACFVIYTQLPKFLPQNLQRVLEWLESEEYGASPEEVSHYKAQCHAIYPRAQAFKPPQTASTSVNDSTSDSTTITTPSTTTTANHNHVDFPSS